MSQVIDSKVVEMKFDNDNFEKNVAESMKTLTDLEKRLENLEKSDASLNGFKHAFDGFDLSKVDKALDSITHRFSVMGQVGASVIHNLTSDAYNLVKTFSSNVWNKTFGQIKSGGKSRSLNIAEAQFRIEGLGLKYEDYKQSIDDAVTGTAYGFDEAAVAASQFAASGVAAGKDMDAALRGISGMAAMTGRSYSDLASVMQDAAAAGVVTNDTFGRLAERGLAALQEYAKRTNQTVDDVKKAAKKGEISFIEFARVMNDAYGEHATKADDTFTGVTANIRAQLSRIGQTFYEPLITNNSDLIEMLKSVKKQIKAIKEYTDPLAKAMANYVLKLSTWAKGIIDSIDVSKVKPFFDNLVTVFDNLTKSAENLYSNILKPFGKYVKQAFYEAFPSLNTGKELLVTISDKLVEASKSFRDFTADIGIFGEKGASLKDTLVAIFNSIKIGVKLLKAASEILKVVIKSISKILDGINFTGMLANFTKFISEAIDVGFYIVYGIANGLISAVPLLFTAIAEVGNMIISAFCSFFGISSPSKVMRDKVGYWLVAGIAEGMKAALKAGLITGAILLVVGLILNSFRKENETLIDVVSRLFDGFIDKIAGVVNRISEWFGNSSFGKAFNATFDAIAAAMTKLSKAIESFDVQRAKEMFTVIKQFVLLGAYVYILVQFAAASTLFTGALYKITRAANIFVRNFRIKYIGATLKNLAIAIGVITGSVLLFAGMIKSNNGKYLLQGLAAMAGILIALIVTVKMVQGAIRSENIDPHGLIKVEAMFMGLGAAIFLIASAIRKVARLDLPQLITGAVTIGMFLFAITGLVIAIEVMSSQMPKDMSIAKNAWVPILGIAVAVRLIAGAISKLAIIARLNPDTINKASIIIGILTAIVGGITLLSQLISTVETVNNSSVLSMAAMVLALGIAIKAMSKAIILLSFIPAENIEQGKKTVFMMMGLIGAILIASGLASKVLGHILLGVAASVAAIAASVWLIGQMEEGIMQGFGAVTAILAFVAMFVGAVNLIDKATGGSNSSGIKSLLYAAACIAAMGAVVYLCGQLELEEIGRGILALTAVTAFTAALGILFSVLSGERAYPNASGGKAAKLEAGKFGRTLRTIWLIKTVVSQIIKMAMVAVLLAKVPLNENEISRSIIMLTGIVGALALLIAAIGAISKECPHIQRMTRPILAATGAILVIAGALILLGQMEAPATVITSMAAISVILLAMGKMLEHAKVFGVQGMSTKGILAAAVLVVGISAALTLLIAAIGEFTLNKLWTVLLAVGALGGILLAIAGAMKIADRTKVKMKSAAALILASLSFVIIAATIAAMAYYVEDLSKIPTCMTYLGLSILAIGAALKISETTKWTAVAGLLVGSLSLLAVAAALAMLASYNWQELLPSFMALVGVVTIISGILAALSMLASTGVGTLAIAVAAGAILALGLALLSMSGAMFIAVQALQEFLSVVNKETADNIVAFFETIGDGIGTAGQHIAEGIKTAIIAVRNAFGELKAEGQAAGTDFAGGFMAGIISGNPLVAAAAVTLGAIAVLALRSEKGIDAHSWSRQTIAAAEDFVGGFAGTIDENSDAAEKPAANLGANAVDALSESVSKGMKAISFGDIWNNIKKQFTGNKQLKWYEYFGLAGTSLNKVIKGVTNTYVEGAVEGVKDGVNEAVSDTASSGGIMGMLSGLLGDVTSGITSESGGIGDALSGLFSGLTSGNFTNVLNGFDWSKLTNIEGISNLKDYLSGMGVTMDNLSGDNIPKLIDKLKEAGFAGNDLIEALKQLGITEDQLKSLGLADALGIEEAKDGVTEVKDVVESIIKGDFGNAPERWDRLFEYFIKNGKTAQEAYAAIADAQNAVNEKLGSNVRHTAAEMEKAVSDSVKKANEAAAKANEGKKEPRDFKKDPHKATPETAESKAKAASEAYKNMMNNMPYENYRAIKEGQITKEKEKQTVEAYKQKLANEHIYTLKEKEAALAGIKANQEKLANSGLTEEARKQLEAENQKYQKVVDTYNTQRDMIKAIEEQENATKKAEEAEKKRGETVKANNSAVVYGSDEYWNQYKNNPNSTKATKVNKTNTKVETPIQTEPVVEVTPKLDVKAPDITEVKTKVVTQVETEIKDLQAKVELTPKVNTAQAEQQIANFKQKLAPLKTDIPKIFEGIGDAVSKHINTIASRITQEGGKIATNTKTVFQNAVSQAITTLNGNETVNKFYNAGKSAAQGYANGIRDKGALNAVRSAGATLGNTASKALKSAIKSNSPSKLFMEIGGYTAEGYAYGILGNLSMVSNASEQMADASVTQLYSAVDAIQQAVNDGIDLSPTVVPVIDATQIQNGLNNMRSTMNYGMEDLASISANIDAKASYDNSQVEEMRNRMDSMTTAFNDLATIMSNQPAPEVTANVNLMGDADGVFKLVQHSNSRYTKMHGKSAFA